MGEAKRRKQAGLMPVAEPFEAVLTRDGQVELVRAPADPALADRLRDHLAARPFGEAWDTAYRTAFLGAGQAESLVRTQEDLQRIPVPTHQRLGGELVLNAPDDFLRGVPADRIGEYSPLGQSTWLHTRKLEYSQDGTRWQGLPQVSHDERMDYLLQHPLLFEPAEELGRFTATATRDGQVTFEPEVPQEWQAELTRTVQLYNGETPEEWDEAHRQLYAEWLADPDEDLDSDEAWNAIPVPASKRLVATVVRAPQVRRPFSLAFDSFGPYDVHISDTAYSLDDQTWRSYDDEDGASLDPSALGLVTFTIWPDGRVELPPEARPLSEGRVETLRRAMLDHTSAGTAGWDRVQRERTLALFEDELQAGLDPEQLPVPFGVRLALSLTALDDERAELTQDIGEYALSFDGETWNDVTTGDLPPELQPFAAVERFEPDA